MKLGSPLKRVIRYQASSPINKEMSPSQLRLLSFESVRMISGFIAKEKRLAEITYGARKQATASSESKKSPENYLRFRGFLYTVETVTRIRLARAYSLLLSRLLLSAPEFHRIMCEALVGFTTDRELHPAPKVLFGYYR